jgi:hypothetical protein
MNNYNFTQSLDGLNNIEADNINTSNLLVGSLVVDSADITTLNDCNLVNCTAETPVNNNSVVRKDYVDNNFMYKTNNIAESITGWKTFLNRVNLNGGTALVVESGTSSFNGTVTLNAQTTFNTVSPISNTEPTITTHLTTKNYCDNTFVDKTTTQTVGGLKTFSQNTNFLSSLLYRTNLKMNEWENQTANTITLNFPMPSVIALRISSGNALILNLPTLTTNERGMIFTFVKLSANVNVTINTSSSQNIYPLNNLSSAVTTNTTLLSADKTLTRLAVGWFGTFTYWIEISDYSTFDRDYNNTIYPRLAVSNTFTNTNVFNSQLTLKNKLSFIDILTPFTKTTEAYQSGSVMINEQNFNLGSYQFKTRDSGGALTSSLTVANTGITIFGKTTGSIFEGTTYNSTSATTDMAIGSTSITGKILIGTVLNGGELRLGTTLSINNINGSTTFSSIPLCSVNATTGSQLVNYTTLTGQGYTTLSLVQANNNTWTGTNTFNTSLPTSTLIPNNQFQLVNKNYVDSMPVHQILNTNNTWTGTNTYNTYLPTSTLTPSGSTDLITKNFADGKFIDFTTDQTINATNKRFNGLFTTGLSITPTVGGGGNRQQIYITGTELSFNPLFDNNYYRFYCRTSSINQINPLEISYNTTIVRNNLISNAEASFNTWVNLKFRTKIYDLSSGINYTQMYMLNGNEFIIGPNANGDKISFYCKDATLGQLNTFISSALGNTSQVAFISNGQATFNNFCPISSVNPTSGNHLTRRDYVENNFVDKTTSQTIGGDKVFNGNATYNGSALYCNCRGEFSNLVYLKNITRIYDLITPFTNYTKLYTSGNNFFIYPEFTSSSIQFFCRNSAFGEVQTFSSSALANTSLVPFIASSTATFNANTEFTGSNGYFQINCGMSSGTYNPASTAGGIGIIGLKDQTNDNVIFTLYGSIYVAIKLNFSSVSMGFGGNTSSPNTSVVCDGTNVIIKPSIKFNGDNTIQNSAFTGAGSLNGTYNLANITIDTNGKITSLSSGASANINFTGNNTFQNYTTFKASLDLLDGTGTKSGNIIMEATGDLVINNNTPSGSINFGTDDSGGSNFSRATINENEFNIEVPLTLNVDYTYYNPVNFTSNRLGYTLSNTGSTNTLTNNVANNSGQIYINSGSWNISYTGTITVITNTITTLTSLEIYVADSLTNDLNIIGINVINYYKISSVPVGQKMRISGSGNYISYTNVSTELNLRLLPLFTAGSGGLNFQGKISATRNA